jgi:sulfate permease, SulP family
MPLAIKVLLTSSTNLPLEQILLHEKENRSPIDSDMTWLHEYRREWLRPDVIAGLTTAALVLPKAIAYATIAGLPVEVGLYTTLVPMAVYAVLGSSRVLSVSTTTTIAILTATELALVVPGGDASALLKAASTLALLVGAFLVVASILKLGFIATFISDPVLAGFKAGIGLVVIVDQLPKLLGIHIGSDPFFRKLLSIAQHISETSLPALALALVTLAIVIGVEKWLPRAPAVPLAIAAGIACFSLLRLQNVGVETVGMVPAGFPSPAAPDLSLVGRMWPGALGIALMSFTESIASGRAFVGKGEPRPNPDQELRALGLANMAGAIFRSMPAGGGASQTAVNRKAGARTQMAELVTAAATAATLLFLTPVIRLIPQAALAAVVVSTVAGLLSPVEFRKIRAIRKAEFRWALVALAGVVLLGSLQGILVAVVASLFGLLYEINHPLVYVLGRKPGTNVFRPSSFDHVHDETFPGLLILRAEGRVYFANAQRIGDKMWPMVREAKPRVLLLDCSAIPDIEYTALQMLTDGEEKLRQEGVSLWLAALNPKALRVIQRSPLGEVLGHQRMFFNTEQAVEAYQTQFETMLQPAPNTT